MTKNKLQEIREKRKMSQSQLARITKISQQQISRYEKDQQLSEESIRKFCEALECNADYLLGLIDYEEKSSD